MSLVAFSISYFGSPQRGTLKIATLTTIFTLSACVQAVVTSKLTLILKLCWYIYMSRDIAPFYCVKIYTSCMAGVVEIIGSSISVVKLAIQ